MKKLVFSLMFLAMMLVVVDNASAQNCQPKADQIAVFSLPEYRGNCTILRSGEYPNLIELIKEPAFFSIILGPDAKVLVCDRPNFKGTCAPMNKSGNIKINRDGYFVSMKAYKNPNAPPNTGNNDSANNVITYVAGGQFLGGYKDGKIIDEKTAAAAFNLDKSFYLYGLDLGVKRNRVMANRLSYDDNFGGYWIQYDKKEKGAIAISSNASWNPVPRSARTVSTKDKTYIGIVRKYLQSKGIAKPIVKIEQILRVDLEGDGQDEVIINARHVESENTQSGEFKYKKGSYSFLIVRKIISGKVKTIRIGSQIFTDDLKVKMYFPSERKVTAILDMDGDGIMEIVTDTKGYESWYTTAHRIKNGQAIELLGAGGGV